MSQSNLQARWKRAFRNPESLRIPGYSPPKPLSFSCVEEAIEALLNTFNHAKLKLLSVLSGIRRLPLVVLGVLPGRFLRLKPK